MLSSIISSVLALVMTITTASAAQVNPAVEELAPAITIKNGYVVTADGSGKETIIGKAPVGSGSGTYVVDGHTYTYDYTIDKNGSYSYSYGLDGSKVEQLSSVFDANRVEGNGIWVEGDNYVTVDDNGNKVIVSKVPGNPEEEETTTVIQGNGIAVNEDGYLVTTDEFGNEIVLGHISDKNIEAVLSENVTVSNGNVSVSVPVEQQTITSAIYVRKDGAIVTADGSGKETIIGWQTIPDSYMDPLLNDFNTPSILGEPIALDYWGNHYAEYDKCPECGKDGPLTDEILQWNPNFNFADYETRPVAKMKGGMVSIYSNDARVGGWMWNTSSADERYTNDRGQKVYVFHDKHGYDVEVYINPPLAAVRDNVGDVYMSNGLIQVVFDVD